MYTLKVFTVGATGAKQAEANVWHVSFEHVYAADKPFFDLSRLGLGGSRVLLSDLRHVSAYVGLFTKPT